MVLGDIFVFLKMGGRDKFEQQLDQTQHRVNSFASNVGSSMTRAFEFALGGIVQQGLNSIASGIQNIAETGFNAVANNERLALSLESLVASQIRAADSTISMGDALAAAGPLAQDMAEWINKVAIASPFRQDEISRALQMAQSFKFGTEQAKELEQALIDQAAASGRNGQAIEQATRALGQMNVGNVVHKEELNQLQEAGIDYIRVLDQMGVSLDDVSAGTVRSDQFIQTLIATLQGDFAGAAERQATSWAGLASTFQDITTIGLREFFQGILEPLQPLAAKLTDTFQNPALTEGVRQLGQAIGDLLSPAIDWLMAQLDRLPSLFERAGNFIRQLRDELAGLTAGDILAGLEPGLAKIQTDMTKTLDVLAQAHKGTLAQLEQDIVSAGEKVGQEMAKIAEEYGPKIAELNERMTETAGDFQERLTDQAEAHAKRRADIEEQITKNSAKLEEKLTELKKEHLRRRNELATSLLTAESEEQYLQIQDQIKNEDEKYKETVDKTKKAGDETKSELEKRLKEEEAAYTKAEAKLKKQRDKAFGDIQEQIDKVTAERNKAAAEVQKTYDAEVQMLRDKIEQEKTAYAERTAELSTSLQQQLVDFEAETRARAAAIGAGLAGSVAVWFQSIKDAYEQGGLMGVIGQLSSDIAAGWPTIQAKLSEWAANFWNWLTGPGGAIDQAGANIDQLVITISDFLVNSWPVIQTKLGEWSNRFWDWILGPGGALERTNEALDNILNRIKGWLDADTTQVALTNIGSSIATILLDGLVAGVLNKGRMDIMFIEFFIIVAQAALDIIDIINKIGASIATGVLTGIVEWFTGKEASEDLKEALRTLIEAAFELLNPQKLFSGFGLDMVEGLLDGLKKGENALKDGVKKLMGQGTEAGKDAIEAHSPSALWAREVGEPAAAGFGLGFEKRMGEVVAMAKSMVGTDFVKELKPALEQFRGDPRGLANFVQNNYLPQLPAGVDAESLLDKIDSRTLDLLLKYSESA